MIKYWRFTKWFCIWLFLTVPLEVLGLLVLSVVLLFTKKKSVQLPSVFGLKLFKWWDNHESYYMSATAPDLDGLAGPDYYLAEYEVDLENYWPRYRARFNWLAIRNPINYFQYQVIGAKMDLLHVRVRQFPDALVDINVTGGHITAETLKTGYWEYYDVIPYSFWKGRALRVRFGWKISSGWRPYQQWCFTISPWYKLKKV